MRARGISTRVRIQRYGPSEGARALGRSLGIPMLRLEGSLFRPRHTDLVINWGSHEGVAAWPYVNPPWHVAVARDKLETFRKLTTSHVPTVEWTADRAEAIEWFRKGATVFIRNTTTGQSGAGIDIAGRDDAYDNNWEQFPRAPLYTKHFNAEHEYRIHVFNGEVIDAQKKRRRDGVERHLIRNLDHGYIFARNNVYPSDAIKRASVEAITSLGLHFGAVDILGTNDGRVAILEVNTAPGLEGSTIESYATAFRRYLDDKLPGWNVNHLDGYRRERARRNRAR